MLPAPAWSLLPLPPPHTYLTHAAATEKAAAEGTFPPRSRPALWSPPNVILRQGRADEAKREPEGEI